MHANQSHEATADSKGVIHAKGFYKDSYAYMLTDTLLVKLQDGAGV